MLFNKTSSENLDFTKQSFPGSFKIEKILLKNLAGVHDIADITSSLSIYEGVDVPFLYGEINVMDVFSTILKKRLNGLEELEFVVSDGLFTSSLKFQCYKIGNRERTNPTSETFTLYFTSADAFKSHYKKISKAYVNKKSEEIITDAFEIVTGNKLTEDTFYFDESKNFVNCVIPNWSLPRIVSFLSARTISKLPDLNSNTYTFWQTFDGLYNFFPIEGLMDSTKNIPYATFQFDPLRQKGGELIEHSESNNTRVMSMESVEIVSTSDHILNINKGMYANRISVVDISQREVADVDYHYLQEFSDESNKHMKLDGKAFPLLDKQSTIPNEPTSLWYPVIKSKGLFTEEKDEQEWINDTFGKKVAKSRGLENFVLEAVLPGNLGISSGMLVNVVLSDGKSEIDPILSGEYLVSRVNRVFTVDKFKIKVRLVKDSIGRELIQPFATRKASPQ